MSWKFVRIEGHEERAKILGHKIEAHDGYYRDNDGSWAVTDAEGNQVARVTFKGKAKRGQGYCAPDPEGMANARLIAAAPDLLEACRKALNLCDEGGSLWGVLHSAISKTEAQ
jgi:hypothetical protein